MLECSYQGCKREAITGGNQICDFDGETWEVDLCAYHLRKVAPDASIK
jgi:hypothetical protein